MATLTDTHKVRRVVHHVFLPPQLPQEGDEDSEVTLIDITSQALVAIKNLLPPDSHLEALDNSMVLLNNIRAINGLSGGKIDETRLHSALKTLRVGQTLVANVVSQNAAVLVTRQSDQLVFEEFELLPLAAAVNATRGRLTRTFPGLAVAVPAEILNKTDFLTMIASTLSTMCHQQAPGTQPQTRKAGVLHDEFRDTTHPAAVSELLMSVLSGAGSPIAVSSISKNTRDEVLWKRAQVPWRRSPMWLLIRVSLQLVISRSSDGSHNLYKEVMVFIMSHILSSSGSQQLPPEVIYVMTAKIQRRLLKLSRPYHPVLPSPVKASIEQSLHQAMEALANRWQLAQQIDSRDLQLPTLSTLNFEQDTLATLPALDDYVEAMHKRQALSSSAHFMPAPQLVKYRLGALPTLHSGHFDDPLYAAANLNQFEQWVMLHIDDWVAADTHDATCDLLHDLMVSYHSHARSIYHGNPEGLSTMVLTIFELWVACDKAALRRCPWLCEYDPGIPIKALQNLLLPFISQMKRLFGLEAYIDSRRARSTRSAKLLFASNSPDSFASKYVDQSDAHLALGSRIVSDATEARNAKSTELKWIKSEYCRLGTLHNKTEHEYVKKITDKWCDSPETKGKHYPNECQKCSYMSQRERLSIRVHEWPLPSDPNQARAVLFGLQTPSWFASWSNSRLVLLQDVLKGERTKVRPSTTYILSSNDPHLTKQYFRQSIRCRIDLMSEVKPALNTHYSNKSIANLEESKVCVPNALQYRYYDKDRGEYAGSFVFKDAVALECTYSLPYSALQRFVFRPASAPDGPDPNTVIASQDTCPESMTLEEYKELGALPLGRHIQWANILLQLAMPSVDFRKPETTLLLLQCAYQAGPRSDVSSDVGNSIDHISTLREFHRFFDSEERAESLLQNLTEALQRIKSNWESSQALFAFVAIAARALSLVTFPKVQKTCLVFLATARHIAMSWVDSLKDKACAAVDHDDRTAFIAKSVESALICISTFDIDNHYLDGVLAKDNDASILVQASVVVQEGRQGHAFAGLHLALLDLRRKRLLSRIYQMVAKHDAQLDDAIKKSWSAYTAGSSWRKASETADHWVTTQTLSTTQAASVGVHYNLLSGELLVNGLPLDRPPKKYRDCPLYSKLFGKTVVKTVPSTTPGFQFSAKRQFKGFAVQLGMLTDGELIVRATKGDLTYDSVPYRVFENAYPFSFARDYLHWFHLATNTVQFRPAHDPWNETSAEIWTLSQVQDRWRLAKSDRSVVVVGSLTSLGISRILEPLAYPTRIHNILQSSDRAKTVHVSIPTLRLRFNLAEKSTSLESQDFRSMAVDTDQSLGTLIGLRSKIVLKHLTNDDRMVLVPESTVVKYSREGAHISVAVVKDSIRRVHSLRVDGQLGRLLDTSDLGCKLFLAYLHALTSFCLVDPLTQKTGVEQALTILRSAAVRSFDLISQEQVDMLEKIADLSPGRCYYPTYLRNMQTVYWKNNVSFLSQDGQLITAVRSLLQQAKDSLLFFPDAQLSFPSLDKIDDHLLRRDNARSAIFRVSGFGAENHTTEDDQKYDARDRHYLSPRATRVFDMSRLIFQGGTGRFHSTLTAGRLWQKTCAVDIVHGAQLQIDPSSLTYDDGLFESGPDSIIERLPALHRWLGDSAASKPYKFTIMMWLSTMVFDQDADVAMLQLVAMLYNSPVFAEVRPPQAKTFSPKKGNTCSKPTLSNLIQQYLEPYSSCPEQNLPRRKNEKRDDYHHRRKQTWRLARDSAIETIVGMLADQWPCADPSTPEVPSIYVNVDKAMPAVKELFKTWYENRLLEQYLAGVQQKGSNFSYGSFESLNLTLSPPSPRPSISGYVSERTIFMLPAPELLKRCHSPEEPFASSTKKDEQKHHPPRLDAVLETLEGSARLSRFETQYVVDLRESLDALAARAGQQRPPVRLTYEVLSSYLESCTKHVSEIYDVLETAVTPKSGPNSVLSAHQRPRVSPTFFLGQLSRERWRQLSDGWKSCIVSYAIALTAMQRAGRLIKLTEKEDVINELRTAGHRSWDPMKHPESLLMEVESSILIRDVQAQVAAQMQAPPDCKNAVMQLNMGEGKSSVIVPIVAAALANGTQLLRVVVAKPQSKQMAQMLVSKLGGLLDRRVYYMPVSRSLKLDTTTGLTVSNMLQDCMSSGGVLLIQPEHILSFQLMAVESCVLGRQDVGQQLMSTQNFFEQNARDIVDESDENFSVRFELIYTMGTQRPIELSPDRWLVLQQILGLVRLLAPGVAQEYPNSMEYHPSVPGGFPRIRILRSDAGEVLRSRLADHICKKGLDHLQVSRQPEEVRNAVHTYMLKAKLDGAEISAVEDSLFWTETTKPTLLLIRGILACGVLEFVLSQKRWRVNYGLAVRTPPTQLAVPYRAKDSPSPRSEFSHPDVVIALTSLSYYYGGLSDENIFTAMGRLMESDQSDIEYQAWVRDSHNLPAAFKQLQGINLKDRPLCLSEVFPPLRFAKSVIDFFLSHIVFPKQMKEFPYKLSASGWDIGKRKNRPVTGFSGTNDSRCLLPIDVHHLDHPEQKHTNALVLEYLLQPGNGIALQLPVAQSTSDAEHLLAAVLNLSPPVQVILDVGAQILELNNVEVAKAWLQKHDKTKEAAVFVNDDDELCVIDREHRIDLLQTSSFSARLDSCLIFLDEAHTRGIDLRLPTHYRAAVTLGAGLTKDRLVQACMRMRKLGKGQTVVFCISQEIQAKIVERTAKARTSDITVSDVILWSIAETHQEIRRSMPLWAVQGERFTRQEKIWQEIRRNGSKLVSSDQAEEFQEDEAQSLDRRFRPHQAQSQPLYLSNTSDAALQRIAERCQQLDGMDMNSSTLQEEQERELSPEMEQERQVQRAPSAPPARHSLHKDIQEFAFNGVFTSGSAAYMPAFDALKHISAARDFSVKQLAGSGRLLVSADFARTIVPSGSSSYISDAFQRPVQWLLASREEETAVINRIIIISPYEANLLYKRMECSTAAALHIYKPRCNSGYASLDRLDFHVVSAQVGTSIVPRPLAIQLDLFAGQLYISTYDDYKEICRFLGLSAEALTEEMSDQGWKVAADGFILNDERGRLGGESGLRQSPIGFLKILMSKIRRNGDGIAKTHMGSLLEGRILQACEFDEELD